MQAESCAVGLSNCLSLLHESRDDIVGVSAEEKLLKIWPLNVPCLKIHSVNTEKMCFENICHVMYIR